MTLKKAVKIIFFKQIEDTLKCDADLFLTYELMLFHLRNVPLFDEKLLFCESLDTYEASMKSERIAAFVGFSYIHLNLANKSLLKELKPLLARLLILNVQMGVTTILTKSFWHDTDAASAFLVESRHRHEIRAATRDKLNEEEIKLKRNNLKMIDSLIVTRNSFYFQALNDVKSHLKKYFYIHLYLLETVALNERTFDGNEFQPLRKELAEAVNKFKAKLALLFYNKNVTNSIVSSSDNLKGLCDIFDGRLFARGVFILDKHFENEEAFNRVASLMHKDFFQRLLENDSNALFEIEKEWVI